MRFKIVTLLLCFLQVHLSYSQLSLQSKPVQGLKFQSKQIWNLAIISTLDVPVNIILTGEISASKGQKVARLVSAIISVSPGLNSYDETTIVTNSIFYLNNDYGTYEMSNGFLPGGDYSYCVQLQCADQACRDQYKSEYTISVCADVIGINPSPLLLSLPSDEEIIETKRPNFNWIPPMPLGGDPALTYEFTLVELNENQSGENAIRRNRALYVQSGIQAIALAFPGELEDLEEGKRYAWQVKAVLGKTVAQISEVWEFEIRKEEIKLVPMPFVKLKKDNTDSYNAVNELNFIFNEKLKSSSLLYIIYDEHDKPVNSKQSSIQTKYGENAFALDLKGYGLISGHKYRAILTDSGGNQYELRFRYYFKP